MNNLKLGSFVRVMGPSNDGTRASVGKVRAVRYGADKPVYTVEMGNGRQLKGTDLPVERISAKRAEHYGVK